MAFHHERHGEPEIKPDFNRAATDYDANVPFLHADGAMRIPAHIAIASEIGEPTYKLNPRQEQVTLRDRFYKAHAFLSHFEQQGVKHPNIRAVDQYLKLLPEGWQRGDRITPKGPFQFISRQAYAAELKISQGSPLDQYLEKGGQLLVVGANLEIRATALSLQDLMAALEVERQIAGKQLSPPEPSILNKPPAGTPRKSDEAGRPKKSASSPACASWLEVIVGPEHAQEIANMNEERKEVFAINLGEKYSELSVRGLSRANKMKRVAHMQTLLRGGTYSEVARIAQGNYRTVTSGLKNMANTIAREMDKDEILDCLNAGGDAHPAVTHSKPSRRQYAWREKLEDRMMPRPATDAGATPQQRQMIEANIRHVRPEVVEIGIKWALSKEEFGEAMADGYFGLARAVIKNFDPARSSAEATTHAKYISRSIKGEVLRGLRERYGRTLYVPEIEIVNGKETPVYTKDKKGRRIPVERRVDGIFKLKPSVINGIGTAESLDAPLAPGDKTTLAEVTDLNPSQTLEDPITRREVFKLIKALPEREQKVFLLRYYGDFTQLEIAKQIGVAQGHVSRLLRDINNKLEPVIAIAAHS